MMTFAFATLGVVVVAAFGGAGGNKGLICLPPLFALAAGLFLERVMHFHAVSFLTDGVDNIGHVNGLAGILGSKVESQ
jgi:predicted permease